jgi:polyphosphate kinase
VETVRTDGATEPAMTSPDAGAQDAPIDLGDPSLYIDRELSLLEFNRRVLANALDADVPLLERLRFLTISCSNLDEFFEVRVAGLREQVAFGVTQKGPDGATPEEALRRVGAIAHELVEQQYRALREVIQPALQAEGIAILQRVQWTKAQAKWVRTYFDESVAPVLTPLGIDPAHPIPRILNKSLNFVLRLSGTDAFGRPTGSAMVQVPRCLPRLIRLPAEIAGDGDQFVSLASIVRAHLDTLFPGMKVIDGYEFRVTRNSDLWVDEEEVDDLMHALKGELLARHYGDAVRLEVSHEIPDAMAAALLSEFGLDERDLYRVDGPVNMHRLSAVYDLVDRPELKFGRFTPGSSAGIEPQADLFEFLSHRDVLLHHPFQSFAPVVDLVRQAAQDPDVLAIKQTLYRTGSKSPVVEALIEAARAGKEVTAVVELKARFDEAANIKLASQLQDAGATVVYGVVRHKTHAKMLLIVRREAGRIVRYVHLGTGNYHSGTAKAYTDFGLMTADRRIGEDVHKLFLQLTGLGRAADLQHLVQSPFDLYNQLLKQIELEAEAARRGEPARIIAKMNSLSEPGIIRALYKAARAGVQIDLVIRGICCLRPGVPGVSDNIRVRSVVGRFLEHHRIYHFHAGGEGITWCASADWMQRNLFRRVEAAFPVADARLRERVVQEGLMAYLEDNCQSWELQPDGTYERQRPGDEGRRSAQETLMLTLGEAEAVARV